jgi:hypothetical protein
MPAAIVTAVRQTAKPPTDSPMQGIAGDSSLDLNADIISSMNGAAHRTKANASR